MSFLSRQETYSFTTENFQYLFEMSNKERTLFNIKNKLNKALNKIDYTDLRNQRILKGLTFLVALMMISEPAFASGSGIPFIDKMGNYFLRYARGAGYWVCIIKAIMAIVESVSKDELNKCWKKVIGYAIAFASLYFIPDMFDSIRQG